jgi:small subunit ribosomal protein S20
MANHKSSLKRIRSNDAKADRNRYQLKTTRTFIKKLRTSTDKKEAEALLIEVTSMIDKLAKKNIIHKNNAAHKKSKLTKLVSALGGTKTAAPAAKTTAAKKVPAAK